MWLSLHLYVHEGNHETNNSNICWPIDDVKKSLYSTYTVPYLWCFYEASRKLRAYSRHTLSGIIHAALSPIPTRRKYHLKALWAISRSCNAASYVHPFVKQRTPFLSLSYRHPNPEPSSIKAYSSAVFGNTVHLCHEQGPDSLRWKQRSPFIIAP